MNSTSTLAASDIAAHADSLGAMTGGLPSRQPTFSLYARPSDRGIGSWLRRLSASVCCIDDRISVMEGEHTQRNRRRTPSVLKKPGSSLGTQEHTAG
jgi:hypothetical protein